MTKIIRHGYSIWKKLVRLKKLYCFLLFQIQTCLTSHIHYYQSSGVRILNLPPIFCCYSSINQYIYIYIYVYTEWVLKCPMSVENWISVERFKSSNTGLLPITPNASFGDIQLCYCKITKIWRPHLHLFALV